MIMALGMLAPIAGCGEPKEDDVVVDTVLEMNSQKNKAADAVQDVKDAGADIDAIGMELLE